MGQLAYKTAGHEASRVKGSLPEDYVTEYIDPSQLSSLDGWQVDEDTVVLAMIESNPQKLEAFKVAQAVAFVPPPPPPEPTLNDLLEQLNDMKAKQDDLQKLILAKIGPNGNP